MRLGATIRRADRDSMLTRARQYEDAGVDVLWAAELYGFDAVSLMGFLAAATSRPQIGSSILPFYSRSPTLLAMSAAGVDALSGGRAILGIGSSGPQVIEGFHGIPFDGPVTRVEEIIEICRAVWRRDSLVHEGRHYQVPLPPGQGTGLGKPLKMIDHPVRDQIPVFVAALGPRNVAGVARLADGWIPTIYWPERAGQAWGEPLAAGRARRDPGLGPLEVVAGVTVGMGEDAGPARAAARQHLALYLGGMGARDRNFYNDLACRYGLEGAAREVQELYLAGKKEAAAAAVPDELIDGTTMIGPPEYVRDRIAAYREAGVTILNARPAGPEPHKTLAQLREWMS